MAKSEWGCEGSSSSSGGVGVKLEGYRLPLVTPLYGVKLVDILCRAMAGKWGQRLSGVEASQVDADIHQ